MNPLQDKPFTVQKAAMPLMTSGITLTNVTYAVAGKPILSGLTARLTEHRIGIIGRNGSGKTTILRLIAGLIAPTSGTVTVSGLDPAGDRRGVVRALGILFQNPDHQILFPTVAEEIAFGLRQLGQTADAATAHALATLARHGRSHWHNAPTHSLSQGQRHYLCLMSVLAMQPDTILLDEPLAGLDLPTQARLKRAFDALPQRLVTITHDPAHLAGYDRVLWLEAGRIQMDGPPPQVLPAFCAAMDAEGAVDADIDLTH
jgi:biotin transport system ATP-binding protein